MCAIWPICVTAEIKLPMVIHFAFSREFQGFKVMEKLIFNVAYHFIVLVQIRSHTVSIRGCESIHKNNHLFW